MNSNPSTYKEWRGVPFGRLNQTNGSLLMRICQSSHYNVINQARRSKRFKKAQKL